MHHIRITFPYYDWINVPIFFQICNLDWIVYIRWQSNHCDCWYKPELCCLDVILNRPESQLPSMKIAIIRIIPTFRSHFHIARVNFTQIPPEHNDHRIESVKKKNKAIGQFSNNVRILSMSVIFDARLNWFITLFHVQATKPHLAAHLQHSFFHSRQSIIRTITIPWIGHIKVICVF